VAIASAGAGRSPANLDELPAASELEITGLGRASVALWLIAIAGLSFVLRIALLAEVHGPWVFPDELYYQKLAQSIGRGDSLALFDKHGLSVPPLYSAVLAPIYGLGASASAAYEWIKIVNAILMSLSVIPIYKIARFVLPRSGSLIVAGLSALAPLMYYSALATSENLTYPLFLIAIWAMLIAIRSPGWQTDALVLASIIGASAARFQMVVLFPAALSAVALAALLGREGSRESRTRSLARSLREHWLIVGSVVALALVAVGHGLRSFGGVYSDLGEGRFPPPWRLFDLVVQHLAGLDLAVGVIPFVGSLVAGYVFFRHGARNDAVAFAAVAVSVTSWFLVEVGIFSADLISQNPGAEVRIHERYLFYVVPLFLVALIAAVRFSESRASFRVFFTAALIAGLLPAAIPFHKVINNSIVADSFGLQSYGKQVGDKIVPIEHATIAAISTAALLGLVYVLVRNKMRGVVILTLVIFAVMTATVRTRIVSAAGGETEAVLPKDHRDWVDQARPKGDVVLVTGVGTKGDQVTPEIPALAAWQTAFNNFSITSVYYSCDPAFGTAFGEKRISMDRNGQLLAGGRALRAHYAVVPPGFGVRGRVLAWNRKGGLVLVAPAKGRLIIPPSKRGALGCERQARS
jgi:hypothetical protein